MWRQWNAGCRFVYNKAIAYQYELFQFNSKAAKKDRKKSPSKRDLRQIIMGSDLPEWVQNVPCHIRQNAIFEAHAAFKRKKSAWFEAVDEAKKQKTEIPQFKPKFRSCKAMTQTLQFNSQNFNNGQWYSRLTKGLSFESSEPIPVECDYGTELVKTRDGRWFAIFPEATETTDQGQQGVIALDPGVRTFLTGYDGQSFIEFGKADIARIVRLCQHLDDLISRMSKTNARHRRKMRQAADRMRSKIRNLIDEAHKKIAHFLATNYRVVILPRFEPSGMILKAQRKIRSKTVRSMLNWAHYRFSQTLKWQCQKHGSVLVRMNEAYTSKTCAHCGHIHTKLGGSKIFKCPHCGVVIDRDFNGALGIFLKALRDSALSGYWLTDTHAVVSTLFSNDQRFVA